MRTWGEVHKIRARAGLLPEVDPRGRVFLDGESADQWHHGAGGGLFFTTPGRPSLVSVQVARSERSTAVYVRGGQVF